MVFIETHHNDIPEVSLGTCLTNNMDPKSTNEAFVVPLLSTTALDKAKITETDEPKLLEPFSYYRNLHPGKGRRRKLLHTFNYHLSLSYEWVEGVVSIIEDLHNSSLLVDDIEDNSPLRRGSPAAHVTYGVAPTINSANYVYFLALNKTAKLADDMGADREKMVSIFVEEMLELHRGQGMEIWWRQNRVLPTIEQYLIMVERKTGGLLRLGVRLLQCHPECPKNIDLVSVAEAIGTLYQVRDDYINLASTSYVHQKGFAEDISEGKYSFPIIHSLNIAPHSGLAEILCQKPESIQEKQAAIDLISETDSFDYTILCLQRLQQWVHEKIRSLGGNPCLEKFVSQLSVNNIGSTGGNGAEGTS